METDPRDRLGRKSPCDSNNEGNKTVGMAHYVTSPRKKGNERCRHCDPAHPQARRRPEIDFWHRSPEQVDRSWREEWDGLAVMEPPEEFRKAAEALYKEIDSLRKAVVAHFT